ncbi:MAG TPA: PTS sugar transporter subunit IIA [Verrucomicrobiae bacterium]
MVDVVKEFGDVHVHHPILATVDVSENRWQAIDELIDILVARHKIKSEHRVAISESIRKRELAMSTGIGFGIAIPHAASALVSEVVGAVGRSRKGVQFDALDGKPVKLVMLFLVPQGQFQKHAHTLANIAKMLHKADFREDRERLNFYRQGKIRRPKAEIRKKSEDRNLNLGTQ